MNKPALLAMIAALLLTGCQSMPQTPIATVDYVDLPRFMGDWYVIASIPTFVEEGAHNAIESYRLAGDGTIETTFTFRAGSFDGPVKRYNPRGFVVENTGNAVWGMQFIWPFKADYRIVYLAADYSVTMIGRQQRDYLWIMARTPSIPDTDYAALVKKVAALGYETAGLRRVPQRREDVK
jgi:apolipoprotein D and lipocalin family protein